MLRKKEDDIHRWNRKARGALRKLDLKAAVKCPTGVNIDDWLAHNVIDFFNQIILLYGCISDYCTNTSCPVMSAGPKYEYHWADGVKIKKPIKVSAPDYVDYLMTWIQNQLDDEKIFPSEAGSPYPHNFTDIVKYIIKRLFRVYAHIYCAHSLHIGQLQAETHLNTSFKHFMCFFEEHDLITKEDQAPLAPVIQAVKDQK